MLLVRSMIAVTMQPSVPNCILPTTTMSLHPVSLPQKVNAQDHDLDFAQKPMADQFVTGVAALAASTALQDHLPMAVLCLQYVEQDISAMGVLAYTVPVMPP